jgi:hypothetical protein
VRHLRAEMRKVEAHFELSLTGGGIASPPPSEERQWRRRIAAVSRKISFARRGASLTPVQAIHGARAGRHEPVRNGAI